MDGRFDDTEPRPLRFSTAQIVAMIDAGVFAEIEGRVEVEDGVVLLMPIDGDPHVQAVALLLERLLDAAERRCAVLVNAPLVVGEGRLVVPDILVARRGVRTPHVSGADIHLVVEVADSSLRRDLGHKRALYAALGAPEYWVVDLEHTRTHRFAQPAEGDYALAEIVGFDAPLAPPFAPDRPIRLADRG